MPLWPTCPARWALVPLLRSLAFGEKGTNAQRAVHVGHSGMAEREAYTRGAVAVVFPTSPGATTYKRSFGKHEPVRVRVTYLFHCGVPVISWVMCRSLPGMISGAGGLGRTRHLGVLKLRPRSGAPRYVSDLGYVTEPWRLFAMKGRYLLLSAEAVQANQAADYPYHEGG